MKLRKQFVIQVDGYKIYEVDGAYVRDNLDISFTLGSHSFVDKFVPKGEIWLNDGMKGKDRDALIVHEVVEANLMERGLDYETAHSKAEKIEKVVRNGSQNND